MQDANLPEDAHEALYVGAPVSKLQCSLFIHHHFDKFKPSREEKSSILQLIGQLCPPENKCFPSIHLFDQYINNGGKEYSTIFEYCGACHRRYQEGELQCPIDQTQRYENPATRSKKDFFIMFNLEAELRTRCKDPQFWEQIQHPITRTRPEHGEIEDIYDGTLYPKEPQLGQLHSLSSTDGIKVFKTNNSDLWVVMLVILELPPSIR